MSFLIYFGVFLSSLGLLYLSEKYNRRITVKIGSEKRELKFIILKSLIVFFPPILLAAYRYGIGTDYNNYYKFFVEQSYKNVMGTEYTGMEFMFRLVTRVVTLISHDEKVYFGVLALLMFYLLYLFLDVQKASLSKYYLVFFFLCIYYGMSYNIIRQTLAICAVTYAFHYFMENSFLKYALWVTIAGLFHGSAFVMIPLYFLKLLDAKKVKKILKVFFMVLIITFPLYFNQLVSLSSRYATYLLGKSSEIHYSSVLFAVEKIALLVPILYNRNKLSIKYRKLINFLFADLALTIPMMRVDFLYRLSYYFLIIYGIIISNYLKNAKNTPYYKTLKVYYILFPVCFFVIHYIILGNHQIYPYQMMTW